MKFNITILFLIVLMSGCFQHHEDFEENMYPSATRLNHFDDLHGVRVHDPYRWLESIDSEETVEWLGKQKKLTSSYLESLPYREVIQKKLSDLDNYDKYGLPFRRDGRTFYYHKKGLQNHSVLYWQEGLEGPSKTLLDPNTFSEDGSVSLGICSLSRDGKYAAYQISKSGSDWREIKIRQVDTGRDFSDHLKWVKFSGMSWTHDNQGFFYSRYSAPEEGQDFKQVNFFKKLYYHKLGTDQSQDTLVYENPSQKKWDYSTRLSMNGRYLIISVSKDTSGNNAVFYKDLKSNNNEIIELLNDFDASYDFVGNIENVFYFETNHQAPLTRLVSIDIQQPKKVIEVIPESKDNLRRVKFINHQFVCTYLKQAYTDVRIFDVSGEFSHTVELPGLGSAGGFGGLFDDTETYYSYSSFNCPATIFHYDFITKKSSVFRKSKINCQPDDYVVKQVFYPSKDGTKVSLFICHKKGLKLDGNNPTYLTGYGGFNIPMNPRFSSKDLLWMDMGGVFAMANLRGGGEYGREWYLAGTKHDKQNVFDDFIGAAEWLIESNYTAPKKIAIAGGSNGGLLVGAVLTQRPDLFGVCLPSTGVLDMLRFHKFTIGWAWTSDYGSPDDVHEFESLKAYSPYHNVSKNVAYPPTLIMTADHDDRVFPAHSFKFAAELQHAQKSLAPVLLRVESNLGHGAGITTEKRIQQQADELAFIMKSLDMKME